ncbi:MULTISPECIES: hypothetical protein [unclassified Haloferax]|uniref:hypothetical protein n=1 Tax=Haloferax TaxID=2251 RepID=UPI0002B0EEBD|nr:MULTISPECIES: hypothetical protein [unclassified Haloferax]ELZ55266.1 hypothetical protein C460_16412 [Haloferax sp. ATCC BAA-646]ELZ66523.1 hypothetical protein C459_03810 [Haloferax sp. ATCC BAA-645]ELZ66712.1 hypothetical protein C458_11725 [Haloferax sp. ATCC BAA-644]
MVSLHSRVTRVVGVVAAAVGASAALSASEFGIEHRESTAPASLITRLATRSPLEFGALLVVFAAAIVLVTVPIDS